MAITIISQPSALALSGNLGKVELDTGTFSGQVTFQLCIPGSTPNANPEIITSQIYFPDSSHRIVIDLSRIISEQLSFNFQPADITQPWRQTLLARTFYFTAIENADGAAAVRSDDFICIRAGIDNLQESVAIWLTANFLTWQPTVKRVTYSTPEFLTYYAQAACTVHVRIYYPDGSDPTDHTLAELTAGAWTIPVSYSVIAALLELTTPQQLAAAEHLPGAYDIWIEDSDSTRLTYIQRYLASALRENEQWVLFENSLGGIDCFRAYGQGSVETEHQHQTAEIDNDTTEYRIDTIRRQKRSTGWLDKAQRRWLLDFFPASRRWLCQDGVFRPIILTDDSVTYALDNMPAEFEFTFRYTTGKPYLNLSRLLTLPSVLDIQAPDMQSFTVPPRLVEFPRIGPSEGALIPAQLPHSDNWAALSLPALLEHLGGGTGTVNSIRLGENGETYRPDSEGNVLLPEYPEPVSVRIVGNDTLIVVKGGNLGTDAFSPNKLVFTLNLFNIDAAASSFQWQHRTVNGWMNIASATHPTIDVTPDSELWHDDIIELRIQVTVSGIICSDTITLRKLYVYGYTVELSSEQGTSFRNGVCQTTLKATILYRGEPVPDSDIDKFAVEWHKYTLPDLEHEDNDWFDEHNIDRTSLAITLDYKLNSQDCFVCTVSTTNMFTYDFPISF